MMSAAEQRQRVSLQPLLSIVGSFSATMRAVFGGAVQPVGLFLTTSATSNGACCHCQKVLNNFEQLFEKVEDKLRLLIPCNLAVRTNARSFPVKRNTLAVAREFTRHRER